MSTHLTVSELADLVGGRLVGDGSSSLVGARPLKEAQPGEVSFLENERFLPQMRDCRASVVLVPPTVSSGPMAIVQVRDPLDAFVKVVKRFRGEVIPPPRGIDPRSSIHPSVRLGADASIQAFVSIGEGSIVGDRCRIYPGVTIGRNCRLGDDVVLHPHAVLYDNTVLGHRVIVHANAVLGADGFGYRLVQGKHAKVPQLGNVEIADDVEIGACTTIDRSSFSSTRIGEGTKIDNLVQVGHNCTIGMHNLIVSQVGLAGSCVTGNYVVLAGQCGLSDHLNVGDRAIIGAGSGVHCDVEAGKVVLGTPVRPQRDFKKICLYQDKLPEMHDDIERIKEKLGLEPTESKHSVERIRGRKPQSGCRDNVKAS